MFAEEYDDAAAHPVCRLAASDGREQTVHLHERLLEVGELHARRLRRRGPDEAVGGDETAALSAVGQWRAPLERVHRLAFGIHMHRVAQERLQLRQHAGSDATCTAPPASLMP